MCAHVYMCVHVCVGLIWHCTTGTWTNVYLPHIGNQWQKNYRSPSKYNSMNQWLVLWLLRRVWVRGCIGNRNDSKIGKSPKADPKMSDSSWKLETWSTVHTLWIAEQSREYPFLASQLIWASSWKLGRVLPLLGSWTGLRECTSRLYSQNRRA